VLGSSKRQKEEVLLRATDPCGLLGASSDRYVAMRGESTSSATAQVGLGPLPLTMCIDCHRFIVVRRVLKKPSSLGQVFYYCPMHKVLLMLYPPCWFIFSPYLAVDVVLVCCRAMVKIIISFIGTRTTQRFCSPIN